jgi:hypothetical protein
MWTPSVFRWKPRGCSPFAGTAIQTVDGIDNPSPDDFDVIREDSDLALYDREALNIFYVAVLTPSSPGATSRSASLWLWASTASASWTTSLPRGFRVASHFTPAGVRTAAPR